MMLTREQERSYFRAGALPVVFWLAGLACVLWPAAPARAAEAPSVMVEVGRVLLLRDYNTRVVVLGTVVLGAAGGLIGTFLLLRKRSLMGDTLSHATLPGIAAAFMLMVAWGGSGKWLPGLLAGAALFGLAGVAVVMLIRSTTRLKDDTAMGIVLSVFFGVGVALLGVIQDMPQGSAAGLESFIYGKTASMVRSDFLLIASAAGVVVVVCVVFFKELAILCFDEEYAAAQGWPVTLIDVLMLTLVTVVTVIGLQAVGLILVIALLVIPSAAARFWTEQLVKTTLVAALIGAASGWVGASISALVPRMPAGAVIVVVGAAIFVVSLVFGTSRGVLVRAVRHWRLVHKVDRQHLLRAFFEVLERPRDASGNGGSRPPAGRVVSYKELLAARSWSKPRLLRLLAGARRAGLVRDDPGQGYCLTEAGALEAARVVRNHRLWEIYLVTHADIAPSHVDRDADQIEHVLPTGMITRLEALLHTGGPVVPVSPHRI